MKRHSIKYRLMEIVTLYKYYEIIQTYLAFEVSKVGDLSRGWPDGSFFNSYYTELYERALLYSLNYSSLFLIRTL